MKKSIFMLGMALTASLISCTDDDLGNGTVKNPVQTGDEILFGSTLSGDAEVIEKTGQTRTVYGDRTSTGVPVYWEADGSDEIAIFCLQASQPADHLVNYKVTPDSKDQATAATVAKVNTSEAGLQWGDPNEEHRFYAFYPASRVKGSAEENQTGLITASIPVTQQVQEWRQGKFESSDIEFKDKTCYFGLPNMDYAYMYAYNAVTPSKVQNGQFIDLNFKNLVTVLDITVQGPEDEGSSVIVTNINVDAIGDDPDVILTGDFTCNIRAARDEDDGTDKVTATCTPVPSDEVRNRISIPCYAKNQENEVNKGFIKLESGQLLNVKAYIIPQDENNTVTKQKLRISVATLNGAPCRKTLNTADVTPHKINRVILPKLVSKGTNYWLSNLDPNIYFSELSIPGSFQSAGLSADGGADAYQGMSIEQQFNDGIRVFSFQTTAPSREGGELKLYYAGSEQSTTLSTVANNIKSYVQAANASPNNKNQKKNEFAVIEVWYKQTAATGAGLIENAARKRWMKTVAQRVNDWATDNGFVVNPSADMTISDLANKVVVIIRYADQVGWPLDPMSPYIQGGTYSAVFLDWQDEETAMQQIPVKFGNPGATESGLTINVTDVTYVNSSSGNGNISLENKVALVKSLFDMSVTNYPNESVSRSNWYLNNLGGFYRTTEGGRGGDTRTYATDMHNRVVDILQDRTQNAAIGIMLMNFADKQGDSGAKYKSDWLIQTIIDNNFKFALRKKPSGSTPAPSYNASYKSGGNAVGWDE